MPFNWIGWDIGGAHIKAAEINSAGEIVSVIQQPCPLWKGLDHLQRAVHRIASELNILDAQHAITMTGELVDLFENRNDGVNQIIAAMTAILPENQLVVYAGSAGFLKPHHIDLSHYHQIASANWLASATLAAEALQRGLFVDIGSTTTDILALKGGKVLAEGFTDYQRLQSQELVYTGIVRTAVMAVAQTAVDEGKSIGLMAEYFATMADVYRLTGELDERHDQADTADGKEKSVIASARRLSRMLGCDFVTDDIARWQRFAETIRAQQLDKIQRSCERLLSRHELDSTIPLIGAGVGRFLVKELASRLGHVYLDFSELLIDRREPDGLSAADCAPAVAAGYLARRLLI
jgi:(4-(4-[2-(gamma-L-glutamylamino)ethyl]phenoxymethyl)furan-2-yl)methanamine synthase